jgi:hypothetical protein
MTYSFIIGIPSHELIDGRITDEPLFYCIADKMDIATDIKNARTERFDFLAFPRGVPFRRTVKSGRSRNKKRGRA